MFNYDNHIYSNIIMSLWVIAGRETFPHDLDFSVESVSWESECLYEISYKDDEYSSMEVFPLG